MITHPSRQYLLKLTDRLLGHIEEQLVRDRQPISPEVRAYLDAYIDGPARELKRPRTYLEAHGFVLEYQRRLRKEVIDPRRPITPGWKQRGLREVSRYVVIGTDLWWELAEAQLDRLYARWDYAVVWARRRPSPARVRAMQLAWADYYDVLEALEAVRREG